jgi:hypothetical protein
VTSEEESARAARNPDRLLPNENPASRSLEDVTHWMAVYRELLTFKEGLLDSAERELKQRSELLGRDVSAATELASLQAQNDRLRRRLEFWTGLHAELAGSQPDIGA